MAWRPEVRHSAHRPAPRLRRGPRACAALAQVRVKMGVMERTRGEAFAQLGVRIPKSLHRAVIFHCVATDLRLMDFVTRALEERLAKVHRRARHKRRGD